MLEQLFGSRLRAKILGWMFTHPDERYYVRQLTSLIHEDSTNISRELSKLSELGILLGMREGRQIYYTVNKNSSVYHELEGLVLKTHGLAGTIRAALKPFERQITIAFIYGSFARRTFNSASDIDIFIIGSVRFNEITKALMDAQNKLGREINPTVYPEQEFADKLKTSNHFINRVIKSEKLFLKGNENELAGLVEKSLVE